MAVSYSFQRYEIKYFLNEEKQAALLKKMEPYMIPDIYGKYGICSIYYDTKDWRLIRASIEKPAYKEKLRIRSYGPAEDNSPVFIELKKKVSGIVYKRRITREAREVEPFLKGEGASPEQIAGEIRWFQQKYRTEPKVFIGYDRLAFAGKEDPELRVTFDTNIRWRQTALDLRTGDFGAPLLPGGEILMEIKIPGAAPLWLSRALSELSIYPTSFSKFGTCYCRHILPEIRRNEALHHA